MGELVFDILPALVDLVRAVIMPASIPSKLREEPLKYIDDGCAMSLMSWCTFWPQTYSCSTSMLANPYSTTIPSKIAIALVSLNKFMMYALK